MVCVSRTDPNTLWYVAHAVWKSTDGGITWVQQSDWWAIVHTDMHQICENPYNSTQLFNMNDGGVWVSTNGGTAWTPKSDGIAGYEIYHGNCSPTRRDMISIGTQDNGELYATSAGWFTNRGGDWGSQCSFDYRTNSSMVYYHQNNKRRLVNGGDVTYGLPAAITVCQDIAFNRSNPDLAFVGDSLIVRTTSLSASAPTWTQIASLGKKIMSMHSHFGDANRLYVITSDAMIYVSTNALSATPTFTSYALPNSTNNAANITSIKNSPNTIYITCNTKVYRSTDNGATWTNVTYNLPSTNHVTILADEYSSSNELVFLATNNSVYYKLASATTWTLYNSLLPTRTDVIDLSIYNDSTSNTLLRLATYGRGMWEAPINSLRELKANFSVSNPYPCTGSTIQFTDLSTGSITSYSWSFPGGTPSTSTLQNPTVTYNTAGNYAVTLTVTGSGGTNSVTKPYFISTLGSNISVKENFETVHIRRRTDRIRRRCRWNKMAIEHGSKWFRNRKSEYKI
ncbi:MAG: PKD domain-containing protein [Bacteroidetes bacterium]|nr:PKD domain-containing protein [Bacteroidota bacterium]